MQKNSLIRSNPYLRDPVLFEDLILRYEDMVARIIDHLGEDPSVHVNRKKYFDPAVSIKNVGLWKNHPRRDEIDLIRRELREYCHEDVDD